MKVAVALAKNILVLLGVTAAVSAIDAGIRKKIYGSGITTLIIVFLYQLLQEEKNIVQSKNKTKRKI